MFAMDANKPWSHNNKMPTQKSKNATGTTRWNKNGVFAAQLFRDLYFKKYKPGEDGTFDTKEIYNDPTREYSQLAKNSFYKHVDTIYQRVQAYRRNGTGLGTEAFRQLVNLQKIPAPDERGDNWEKSEDEALSSSNSDSDDSSYFGAKEDNVELGSEFEDESEDEKPKAKTPKKASKKNKKSAKTPLQDQLTKELDDSLKMAKLNGDLKYMVKLADGRILCVYQLPSGFEGNFEFEKGKTKTKIYLKKVMPRFAYDACRVFHRKGLGANDANIVELQTAMNKQREKDIRAMGSDPETHRGPIHQLWEVFDVTTIGIAEVLPFFLDYDGNETTDINADTANGAEWVFFWLRDKDFVKERHSVGKILRNNTRRRSGGSDDDETERPAARASVSPGGNLFASAMADIDSAGLN